MANSGLQNSLQNNILSFSERHYQDNYDMQTVHCSNIVEVFKHLGNSEVKHVAVLSEEESPITNIFGYIKAQLSKVGEVSLLLFFDKKPVVNGVS